jgi:hypothetical protein
MSASQNMESAGFTATARDPLRQPGTRCDSPGPAASTHLTLLDTKPFGAAQNQCFQQWGTFPAMLPELRVAVKLF